MYDLYARRIMPHERFWLRLDEGLEACHSETVIPLRNTPPYYGSKGAKGYCCDLSMHIEKHQSKGHSDHKHLPEQPSRSSNPSQRSTCKSRVQRMRSRWRSPSEQIIKTIPQDRPMTTSLPPPVHLSMSMYSQASHSPLTKSVCSLAHSPCKMY